MPQTTKNEANRIKPAESPPDWIIHLVNPVLTFLLRSPLHNLVSDQLMLLTITGRSTGTEYTFPMLYDRNGTTISVTSHGTSWWKNLRPGGQDVTVWLRGDERTGHAKLEEANQPVAEYAHEYFQRHGTTDANRIGLDLPDEEIPSVEQLEQVVDHVVLVTIELQSR